MSDLDPPPPADGRSVGAAVAPFLEACGVDVVFGIPGVHNVELYRGLQSTRIAHVLARHEQGAGFMADGYARMRGRPGVCFVISGPGLTNVATPMGQAYSDSIPMLVIAAVRATDDLKRQRGTLHEVSDQLAVARPLSGICATVTHPDAFPALVQEALSSMASGRPRPAFLEIPLDVLASPYEANWDTPTLARRPAPQGEALDRAAAVLRGAKRPILIVGGGAVDAADAIRRLVEHHAIAVLPTIAGKGVVPDHHPLSVGSTLPRPATLDWLSTADVVMAIGTELAPTDSWQPGIPINGTLIRVDLDPSAMAGDYQADVELVADAALTATALDKLLSTPNDPASVVQQRRERLEEEVLSVRTEARAQLSSDERAHIAVLDALHAVLPPAAAVFTDMTRLAYTGNEFFDVSDPRCWFHPVGYGTLGYAVPAAIGARIAAPERPVVALVGDYGFGYTSQEMLVAAERGMALPVVIWNSANLGAIEEDMRRKNIPPTAVEAMNPDFEQLAKAYHCAYDKPANPQAFADAVSAAFLADRPTIIELMP